MGGKKFDVTSVVSQNSTAQRRVHLGDMGPGRDMPQTTKTISLARVLPSPFQPRLRIDPEQLDFLVASIGAAGLEAPIIVRLIEKDGENYFELIDGHRRVEAHRLLGLEDIKATIKTLSDAEAAIAAYSATAVHVGFSDYESGKALLKLLSQNFVRSKTELAKIAGVGRSDFYRFIGLASLPKRFCDVLDEYPDIINGTGGEYLSKIISEGYEDLAFKALEAVRDGLLKESNIPLWFSTQKDQKSSKDSAGVSTPKKVTLRNDSYLKVFSKENKQGGFDLSVHALHESVSKERLQKALADFFNALKVHGE